MSLIERLLADHDKDPQGTAKELRELDPSTLHKESFLSYSWLLNHVLGELAGKWEDSCRLQRQLVKSDGIASAIYRNYSTAAFYAGHPIEAWSAQQQYLAAARIDDANVGDILQRLDVLQYSSKRVTETDRLVSVLMHCLDRAKALSDEQVKAATPIGATLNNIVSGWLESDGLASVTTSSAMKDAALLSFKFWELGGTWVNIERAWYLRTLVAIHLEDWEAAAYAANEGLHVIAAHDDKEEVDKAFFLVALSRAYGGLSDERKCLEARNAAVAIADTFSDTDLRKEFDDKLSST